jgi:hypothetical protein
MKTTNLIGWAGISLLFASVLTTGACSKSAEGFCQSWVEDTCKAIAGCCKAGKTYDEDECRLELSKSCLDTVDLEQIHSGERVFNAGAASECLGSVEKCADLDALGTNNLTYDRAKACKNIVTGFREPGSACSSDKECQQSGEFAFCYEPGNGTGVCVNVVLDDAKCSFSFENNELHICPEGKYCDNAGFKPPASASPTSQEFEFSASCKPDVGAGGKCVDGDGHGLPCAKGLYCDTTGATNATCKQRKAAGTACNFSQECAEGLTCDANPSGNGETCQAASANGPFCFSPPVCGDGSCNGNETPTSCPKDCNGGGGCGDGFCDVSAGESAFCPEDCCGNGSCDPGETTTCPSDCGV